MKALFIVIAFAAIFLTSPAHAAPNDPSEKPTGDPTRTTYIEIISISNGWQMVDFAYLTDEGRIQILSFKCGDKTALQKFVPTDNQKTANTIEWHGVEPEWTNDRIKIIRLERPSFAATTMCLRRDTSVPSNMSFHQPRHSRGFFT